MTRDYLYVIGREEGPVKVGITGVPFNRMNVIQTGCPFKVEILHIQPMRDREHARSHERCFHSVHREKRLTGEWFDMDADSAIEKIETGLEIERYYEDRAVLEGAPVNPLNC